MTRPIGSIAAIAGLSVGHADDGTLLSGVSVLLSERPFVAAVDVRGGAPGTRETDALGAAATVEQAHAIVLSGGSAFGLAAATGVQGYLAARGIGFEVGNARVPIVPQAILFDLLNGGDKSWPPGNPYEALGWQACEAADVEFREGSAGAGMGACTANLRGGFGSACEQLHGALAVVALVAANPVGVVTVGETAHFWAAPFEHGCEFGGLGHPSPWPEDALRPRLKTAATGRNTTIAIVATNARLDRAATHRLAVMAQTGLSRAIYPVHTPLDGDTVFAAATGDVELTEPLAELTLLGAAAANALARAIARAIYLAAPRPPRWQGPPSWHERFGGGR
jgi:L-aminopeptidase/D-esterase-like protein